MGNMEIFCIFGEKKQCIKPVEDVDKYTQKILLAIKINPWLLKPL